MSASWAAGDWRGAVLGAALPRSLRGSKGSYSVHASEKSRSVGSQADLDDKIISSSFEAV